MPVIEANDLACIKDFFVEIQPDQYGVLVYRARNGGGKSTMLEATRSLLSRSGKLRVSDGAAKGSVEGFGVAASVGQQTRYRGESDVPTLEGKFDFSDLVVPAAKDPEVRDRTRIKALLSLTGVEADASMFWPLTKGDREAFEEVVPVADLKTTDIVEMAGKVKRAFEAAARKKKSDADNAQGHADACKAAAEGIDPNTPTDMPTLHTKLQAVTSEHSALVERKEAAERNAEAIKSAEAKREAALASYKGPEVFEARPVLSMAAEAVGQCEEKVARLKQELADAEKEEHRADMARVDAQNKLDAAIAHEKLLAQIQSTIEAAQGGTEPPSDMEITIAERKVMSARAAVENAVKARDGIAKLDEAKRFKFKSLDHSKASMALYEAAGTVDQLLSTKLPAGPLRAEGGRLVLDTERGKGVPFDECSQGEKYRIALPYGIQSVGPGGYLVLVQEGWDGLDHQHRMEVAKMCRDAKVLLITGEVADGELRAEMFPIEE